MLVVGKPRHEFVTMRTVHCLCFFFDLELDILIGMKMCLLKHVCGVFDVSVFEVSGYKSLV